MTCKGLSFLATLTLSRNSRSRYRIFTLRGNPLNKYNQRPERSVSGLDHRYLTTYAAN
jgi:hypothetical protein